MHTDLDKIRDYYAQLTNDQLENIAMYEVQDLREDVLKIVEAEIKKRGLEEVYSNAIDEQSQPITPNRLEELTNKIKQLPCPICNNNHSDLIGGTIRKVRSFIVYSSYSHGHIIGCDTCVERERTKHIGISMALGWWGIPFGVIYTIRALIGHIGEVGKHRIAKSNEVIQAYAITNRGFIRGYWKDKEELVARLRHHNNQVI